MGLSTSAAFAKLPCPPRRWVPSQKAGPTPTEVISTAASLRLGFLLRSSFQKLAHLYHLPKLEDLWLQRTLRIEESTSQFPDVRLSSPFSYSFFFFDEGDPRKGADNERIPTFESSKRNLSFGRKWTNVLLAVNVLVYVAQIASQGKLLMWGAKINSLIDKGQIWRLVTSSLLHANIGHLMVNCYSLNSIGPTVENLTGQRRFLAVYFTSAIASSMTSYWLCKAPAVGASGAIFGLVGSAAVFMMRHRGMIRGGKEDLQYIAQVISINMVIGILSKGIDNWGHVGGLFGGIATSWLLGPSWKYESRSDRRTGIFIDKAPIKYLTNRKRIPDNRS